MEQDSHHLEIQDQPQSVGIEEASLDNLSDEEINALVANFILESSDNLKDIDVSSIEEDVAMRVDKTQKFFRKEFEETVNYIKDLIQQGKIMIVRINGKPVAMIGYYKVVRLPDDRDLYTIMKASTLKEYRGRGIYRKLAESIFQKIRDIVPNFPIFRMTKSDKVKQFLKQDPKWVEFQLDDESIAITKFLKQRKPQKSIEEEMGQGYVRFIFDPLR